MSKLKIDKQTTIFIILATFFLVELAVLLPFSINRIVSVNKKIVKTKKDLENIASEWPNKDNYIIDQDKLNSEIGALREKFLGSKDESKLLSFISRAGKEHRVEIQSMSPTEFTPYPETQFGSFSYFPIRIRARSRYHSLAQFYEFIQSSDYFFEVTEFNMRADSPYNVLELVICGLLETKQE
jgi:Tfp pilus assembly protein PilO